LGQFFLQSIIRHLMQLLFWIARAYLGLVALRRRSLSVGVMAIFSVAIRIPSWDPRCSIFVTRCGVHGSSVVSCRSMAFSKARPLAIPSLNSASTRPWRFFCFNQSETVHMEYGIHRFPFSGSAGRHFHAVVNEYGTSSCDALLVLVCEK